MAEEEDYPTHCPRCKRYYDDLGVACYPASYDHEDEDLCYNGWCEMENKTI